MAMILKAKQVSYTDSNSKLRFAACLPFGKTSFFLLRAAHF
jgi:hypothetical protein